jgi:predicted DNA-binding protein (UPF0251 family)
MALENFPQTRKLTVQIEVWADEDGYPTRVEVTGEPVEALRTRTLLDLAQEGVASQMGTSPCFHRAVYQSGRDENRAVFTVEDKTEEFREMLEARH